MEIINNIKVNTESRNMFPDRKILGVQGENEVEKLVFKLDKFFGGEARLETKQNDTLKYLVMETDIEKEEYSIVLTNELIKDYTSIDLQIRIINENGTVFKSKSETFEILEGINATQEIAKSQLEWVDEVDTRLDKVEEDIEDLKQNGTGGGSGGTPDYNPLTNKPSINNIELKGNKTLDELGIQGKTNIQNGNGINNLQQKFESEAWTTTNIVVKEYIKNDTANGDGNKIIYEDLGDDNYSIKVITNGKSAFNQNGKSQTVGGKAHTEGSKNIAFENNSHAEGNETFAAGKHSHAEGNTTSAIGNASHSEGNTTIAFGSSSHAEGLRSVAVGEYSHAEGADTIAENQYSHSEGYNTVASGEASHAEGYHGTASGIYSHVEGNYTSAENLGAHAEGDNTVASGQSAHAEGNFTTASGVHSHTEGSNTQAENDCSHAEGYGSIASGVYSHAEGGNTVASGNFSHAEGSNTHAESIGSHAEGVDTFASNDCCHAEGYQTKANGIYSHVEGYGTVADRPFSHVEGTFNQIDTNKKYLHIVGNGSGEKDRSNAYTLDFEGNGVYTGELTIKGNKKVATAEELEKKVQKVDYNSTDGALRGRVYVVDHTDTQTTKELRTTGTVDSIPLRNARGNFYVGTPTLALECVNKAYVDGTIITTISNNTLLLTHNQDARLGELTTLILNMPSTIANIYTSRFSFRSGETPTTLTYSATPIKWRGDDCNEEGEFIPKSNVSYEVSIRKVNDTDIVARVQSY